jgi:CheY-like chemotaxis protein
MGSGGARQDADRFSLRMASIAWLLLARSLRSIYLNGNLAIRQSGRRVMKDRKERILYVAENRDNCDFIMNDLSEYEVTCVMSIEDALRQRKSAGFDLILVDDRLPGITGIVACREIRAHDRQIPILILSGSDDEATRKEAMEAGAQGYWPTPTDLEEVRHEIRNLLETATKGKQRMKRSTEERKRESGKPGGGKGRKDVIERTGVYPVSASEGASPDAQTHGEMSWGQGERGAEGYYDHGDSEITNFERWEEEQNEETKPPSQGKTKGKN